MQINANQPTLQVAGNTAAVSAPAGGETSNDGPADPQDVVQLSELAYVDPDEAYKQGASAGTAVGGVLGGTAATVATAATGQPEAAIITGPAGMAVGAGVGYYVGGALAAGAANTCNAIEGIYNWITGGK